MLIALEGIDGSGKGTQAKALADGLAKAGHAVDLLSFPNYTTTFFGHEVGRYLNGEFGSLDAVPIEFAALLYAGDRLELRERIVNALRTGTVVVCDRYTPSNLAHQAGKVSGADREARIAWIERLEYEVFHLPRPDLVFWLDMPVAQAMALVAKKSARAYTTATYDIHEASRTYLTGVRGVYADLAGRPSWVPVACLDADHGTPRPIDAIAAEILGQTLGRLAADRT